jgi:hypothetical protein
MLDLHIKKIGLVTGFSAVKVSSLSVIASVLFFSVSTQAATVVFFSDREAFEAALTTFTTEDFEGIVGSKESAAWNASMTEVDFSGVALRVVGPTTPGYSGAPYESTILANTYKGTITADLTAVGGTFNAVGGWFGNIDGGAGGAYTESTLVLTGTTGILDSRIVPIGDMGAGDVEVFHGWIVYGDDIVSISHSLTGGGYGWEGLDNLTYGIDDSVFEDGFENPTAAAASTHE